MPFQRSKLDSRHNDPVPLVRRPVPPAPMSVVVATKVFGSEHLVALIRHYGEHPGPQKDAVVALGLPQQLVSKSTRLLVDERVLTETPINDDGRARVFSVDVDRVENLLRALRAYSLNQ